MKNNTVKRVLSVALTNALDGQLCEHFDKGPEQEDLTFAFWRPSEGTERATAILYNLALPTASERVLAGNVAFTSDYLLRVLNAVPVGSGIALIHSHIGPGWQGMSDDDIVAERDRLAEVVESRTGLPLVGLTWGTDGAWSARFWHCDVARAYRLHWASSVRVVGRHLRTTFHPTLMPPVPSTEFQTATVSVWGDEDQAAIARLRIGIVGLGSVGSIVAETLSRIGVSKMTLIDHDRIEPRNIDRTLGTFRRDARRKVPKVKVAERLINSSHTAASMDLRIIQNTLLSEEGLAAALDCDVLFSCVDRPFPKHVLNALAYAHLIPVIDGGILARMHDGEFLHADWRIHTVGPEYACMVCTGALKQEGVSLDQAGLLDDPVYMEGLEPLLNPLLTRQNVFPFSLNVASHEVLQFIGLVTGDQRIGGVGPQFYHCYPGIMEVSHDTCCSNDCEYAALTASACDLSPNFM